MAKVEVTSHLMHNHAHCGFKCGRCNVKKAEAQQMFMHFVEAHRNQIPERNTYELQDMEYISRCD